MEKRLDIGEQTQPLYLVAHGSVSSPLRIQSDCNRYASIKRKRIETSGDDASAFRPPVIVATEQKVGGRFS